MTTQIELLTLPSIEPMFAASLWRPWPWAFTGPAIDPKRIENRNSPPWPRLVGHRIAFQATQRFDCCSLEAIVDLEPSCPQQKTAHPEGIVFVARVRGWFEAEGLAGTRRVRRYGGEVGLQEACELAESRWFIGPVAWVLDDLVALPQPVPCKGHQSLLWALPPDVEARVLAQIGQAR